MLGYFLIGMALLWLVGLKGVLFPLLFFGAMWWFIGKSACGRHEYWQGKPKAKAKNDDWDGEYI